MFKFLSLIVFNLFIVPGFAQNIGIVNQIAEASNSNLYLNQIGESNILRGYDSPLNVLEEKSTFYHAAIQFSQSGSENNLFVEQIDPSVYNEIILFQKAWLDNTGDFYQADGSHIIMLNQNSSKGSNLSFIKQVNGTGYINLQQTALNDNNIPMAGKTIMDNPSGLSGIYQEGDNNFIYGASIGYDPMVGVIAITTPHLPAVQISEAGGNWLEIWQTGGNNVVGLYQKGLFDNQTFINQYNGFNTAVLYQEGVGSNFAHIEQAGNMAAYIYQVGGGDNKAVVIQH